MIHSAPPPGFTEHRSSRQTWWIKTGWDILLQEAGASVQTTTDAHGGRGSIQRLMMKDGRIAIVRRYYRGGFVRHFVRDLYWDYPPRPFAELICTEIARQRGVPTVEVLGAEVEWSIGGLYRGLFVTREASGFMNLWEWLRTKPTGAKREAILTTVARVIAQLHNAGIAHMDLNLTNVLVRGDTDVPATLLIDFDRARVFSEPLSESRRTHSLRRLRRSLDKLDPGGLLFSPVDLAMFCQAYNQKSQGLSVLSPC